MSNLWFNIRILYWYVQSGPDCWLSIGFNPAWFGKVNPWWVALVKPIGVYCLFGWHP